MTAQTVFGGDPIGALFFFGLVSLPIAIVLSFLLLARYQRAVLRSMQASATHWLRSATACTEVPQGMRMIRFWGHPQMWAQASACSRSLLSLTTNFSHARSVSRSLSSALRFQRSSIGMPLL